MTFALRDYQHRAIDAAARCVQRGKRRIVIYGPTGAGKTETAIGLAARINARGGRVLFICDLIPLADQSTRRFERAGLRTGVARGEDTRDTDAPVVVTSPQTLQARLRSGSGSMRALLDDVRCVVVDEVHTRHGSMEEVVLGLREDQYAFGLTATPMVPRLGTVWQDMVIAATTDELVDRGLLLAPSYRVPAPAASVDMTGVAPDARRGDYRDRDVAERAGRIHTELVPEYRRMLERAFPDGTEAPKTLVFVATVAEAEAVARLYTEMGLGRFEAVTYQQTTAHKRALVESFHVGEIRGLCSVAVLAKGFDAPDAEVLVDLRPNASNNLTAYVQKLGRIMRVADGKKVAVVLDHAQNLETFRARLQSLFANGPPPLCPGRQTQANGAAPSFSPGGPKEEEEATEGVMVDGRLVRAPRQDPGDPWHDLCAVARQRGYHPYWARHKYLALTGRPVPKGTRFDPRRGPVNPDVLAWVRERNREYARRQAQERRGAGG